MAAHVSVSGSGVGWGWGGTGVKFPNKPKYSDDPGRAWLLSPRFWSFFLVIFPSHCHFFGVKFYLYKLDGGESGGRLGAGHRLRLIYHMRAPSSESSQPPETRPVPVIGNAWAGWTRPPGPAGPTVAP